MSPGRWPANVILSPGMAEILDGQSGTTKGSGRQVVTSRPRLESWRVTEGREDRLGQVEAVDNYGDSGGASRFFLTAGYEPWELEWIIANGLTPCGE